MQEILRTLPNLPDPTAAEPSDEVLRHVGEATKTGRDHLELAGDIDRHGARRAAVGHALSDPARRSGDARVLARAVGHDEAARQGLRARHPAGARARAGALRDRHAARHRAADLPRGRRRSVPRRDQRGRAGLDARRRDPRRRAAAGALRRLLALLPARGGRRRQGHARHLPRAPVRQGRDVLVRRARGERRGARAPAGDRGGDLQRARGALPRREHRGRRPRGQRGEEVRHRGLAARAGALPRGDVDVEHDRLPGPAAGHPDAVAKAASPRSCTRSTAPRWP